MLQHWQAPPATLLGYNDLIIQGRIEMLDRYRELVVLARTLNFNTAAEELHLSQSSLTRHIATLERELGFFLFRRSPTTLTPEGRRFVAEVEKIITEFDEVVTDCRARSRNAKEGLVLSMPVVSNSYWGDIFYESAYGMQARHPDMPPPRFCQERELTIEESVYTGAADVGMVFREPQDMPEGFAYQRLMEFPLAVYFTKDSELRHLDTVTIDDIADRFLVRPTSPHLQTCFDAEVDTFRNNGVEPRYRVRDFEDYDRIVFMLQPDEIFIGNVLAESALQANWPIDGRPLTAAYGHYPVYLLYRNDKAKSHVQEFVEMCREVAARRPN